MRLFEIPVHPFLMLLSTPSMAPPRTFNSRGNYTVEFDDIHIISFDKKPFEFGIRLYDIANLMPVARATIADLSTYIYCNCYNKINNFVFEMLFEMINSISVTYIYFQFIEYALRYHQNCKTL